MPLPSISASDPKYKPGIPRNSWSGPAEGLTYQRAIRALENYGYHAEITVLGGKLLDAVAATPGYRFPQQWNPQAYNGTPAAAPGPGDCYGPALLSLLEYTVYAHGVKPRPADGVLLWSDAAVPNRQAATATYSQVLGDHTYTLAASTSSFSGSRDASKLFTATRGVRVLTDGRGKVLGVVGISTTNISLTLSVGAAVTKGTVEPNCEYELDGKGGLALTRRVPFKPLEPAELHASKTDDAYAYHPPSSKAETPLRFVPDPTNVGTMDTSWVNWIVVSAMPGGLSTDAERTQFLQDFDPDLIDWYGGLSFNRAEFGRSRGVACSASEEFEYEESLQFKHADTLAAFANDGMSRDEDNRCAP